MLLPLLSALCLPSLASADVSDAAALNSWIEKAKRGVKKGAKEAEKGVKKGAKETEKGVKKGSKKVQDATD